MGMVHTQGNNRMTAQELSDSKWNSRKLALAVAIELLATVLLWFDKIGASNWEAVTMATVVGFCASQAAVDRVR